MYLRYCHPGDVVCLADARDVVATVVKVGAGSVTVLMGSVNTVWSPNTNVIRMSQAGVTTKDSLAPAPVRSGDKPPTLKATETEPRAQQSPAKPSKAHKPAPAGPKNPGRRKDIFGVTIGSAAARVNELLLELRKDVTVEALIKRDKSLVRGNVLSHLKRMAKDGLIDSTTKDKELLFSLRSEKAEEKPKKSNTKKPQKKRRA